MMMMMMMKKKHCLCLTLSTACPIECSSADLPSIWFAAEYRSISVSCTLSNLGWFLSAGSQKCSISAIVNSLPNWIHLKIWHPLHIWTNSVNHSTAHYRTVKSQQTFKNIYFQSPILTWLLWVQTLERSHYGKHSLSVQQQMASVLGWILAGAWNLQRSPVQSQVLRNCNIKVIWCTQNILCIQKLNVLTLMTDCHFDCYHNGKCWKNSI